MSHQQPVYYISDEAAAVNPTHPKWDTALPLNRHEPVCPETGQTDENLTYGEYFSAVAVFLSTHGSDFVSQAIAHRVNRSIDPHEIQSTQIRLEKHGAFYHPARIVLSLDDCHVSLVVNVAVSAVGKITIEKEYRHLKRLGQRMSPVWVPRVFGCDRVRVEGQRCVDMFLGEWFEGFHEFHVSEKTGSDKKHIRVWDPHNGTQFFTRNQTERVFEQAAMILTAYYNLETFEQVASWHHAAGDFVVCLNHDNPELKLITVRDYRPLFCISEETEGLETILNTLLIFLLNLSMHLRIDRLDGVGSMVWVETDVVPNIIRGFFKGLELQVENSHIPPAMVAAFKLFLLHLPETDIQDIFLGIVHQMDPKSPDLPVIKKNRHRHVETVLSELRQMKNAI
jgi:hypothetical protein